MSEQLKVGDKLCAFSPGNNTFVEGEITGIERLIGTYKVKWDDGIHSLVGFDVIEKYRRLWRERKRGDVE